MKVQLADTLVHCSFVSVLCLCFLYFTFKTAYLQFI